MASTAWPLHRRGRERGARHSSVGVAQDGGTRRSRGIVTDRRAQGRLLLAERAKAGVGDHRTSRHTAGEGQRSRAEGSIDGEGPRGKLADGLHWGQPAWPETPEEIMRRRTDNPRNLQASLRWLATLTDVATCELAEYAATALERSARPPRAVIEKAIGRAELGALVTKAIDLGRAHAFGPKEREWIHCERQVLNIELAQHSFRSA